MCYFRGIMKTLKTLLAFLIALLFAVMSTQDLKAQSTPDEAFGKIAAAIQAGNADALTAFMLSPVELTVPGADQAYSAQQATFVLKDFFAKHPPVSFSVIHKGNSGATNYATGTYVSKTGKFDANIFLKNVGGTYKMNQLRFEAE
jgi:hypothetical protein